VSGCRKVDREHNWANYPVGVCGVIRDTGRPCPAFRIAVHGTVPLGAGLSSSAALEVSTALALRKMYGLSITDEELAKLCQKAENTYSGAQCGLLDQYTSMFGRKDTLLFTDFRSLEHRTVPLPSKELSFVLAISGVTHTLAESGYNERRESCHAAAEFFAARDKSVRALRDVSMATLLDAKEALDPNLLKRARHVVGEDERVHRGMKLLEQGDLTGFGRLLFESHQSSRDYFENSCPQLDTLVSLAGSVKGVYGARLTGGGWGGASLALLPESVMKAYVEKVTATYRTPAGLPPDIYSVRVANGAELV
jgi:galactokinase